MGASKSAADGGGGREPRSLEAFKGLATIVIPIVGLVAAYYGTTSEIRGKTDILERDLLHLERSHAASLDRMQELLKRIESRLDAHMRLGPDGLPHPQGVIRSLDDLDERVKALESR